MSIRDKLFPGAAARRTKALLKAAEAETAEVFGPLHELSFGIVKAAQDSYEDLREVLDFGKEVTLEQFALFNELLFFFMHLAIRTAHAHRLTDVQLSRLQSYLGPLLARTAVDSFCGSWPVDRKRKIVDEFFENLNDAESAYAECSSVISQDKSFERESLFGRLSFRAAAAAASPDNPMVIMAVLAAAVAAFEKIPLEQLLDRAAVVIDRVQLEQLTGMPDFDDGP